MVNNWLTSSFLWLLSTLLSIAISAKYGKGLGLFLDKIIKIPLKFLHLNIIYNFFQENKQLVVFAIIFILALSATFFLNESIRENSISHIAENLNYTGQEILRDLDFNLGNRDLQKTPLKENLEQIKNNKEINDTMREYLEEFIQKATVSLIKKGLIKSGSNKNSASPNFQITPKGEKVMKYLSNQRMEKNLWETVRILIHK